jgi:hypothetical protein
MVLNSILSVSIWNAGTICTQHLTWLKMRNLKVKKEVGWPRISEPDVVVNKQRQGEHILRN